MFKHLVIYNPHITHTHMSSHFSPQVSETVSVSLFPSLSTSTYDVFGIESQVHRRMGGVHVTPPLTGREKSRAVIQLVNIIHLQLHFHS